MRNWSRAKGIDLARHPIGIVNNNTLSQLLGVSVFILKKFKVKYGIPSIAVSPKYAHLSPREHKFAALLLAWGVKRSMEWLDSLNPPDVLVSSMIRTIELLRQDPGFRDLNQDVVVRPGVIEASPKGLRRSQTIPATKLTQEELKFGIEMTINDEIPTPPKRRGDCLNQIRPCPYASCKYHLLMDMQSNGSMQLLHGHTDPTVLAETCTLDVADSGPKTLEEIGALLSITRERVRQIEVIAMEKLKSAELSLEDIRRLA